MVDIDQVLYRGVDRTTIVHQRTTSTSTGPPVFGPQNRDTVCRAMFFDLPRPSGTDVYGFCLVYPLRVGYLIWWRGRWREEALVCFLSLFVWCFACYCYNISDLVFLFPPPSFLFLSSCVDPGHSDPQVSHLSRAASILPVYAFDLSLHPI